MKVQVVFIVCFAVSGLALENYRKRRDDDDDSATESSEEIWCGDGLEGDDYKATLTHLGNLLSNMQDQREMLYRWSKSSDEKTDNLWDAMQAVGKMLKEIRDGDVDSIKTPENEQKLSMLYKNIFKPLEDVMWDVNYAEDWSCDVSNGKSGDKFTKALANFNAADPDNDTEQLKALLNVMAVNTRQPGTTAYN